VAISVLIVDDDDVDRMAVRRQLMRFDERPEIAEASDGASAKQAVREGSFDCLLLDFRLPDVDGLDLLAELTGEFGDQTPPVVMLTGMGDERIAVEAMRRGARDYLSKRELSVEVLRRAVLSAIDVSTARRDARNAELRMQAGEARYRGIFDTAPSGIALLNVSGELAEVNPAFVHCLGYESADELAGTSIWSLTQSDDLDGERRLFTAVLSGASPTYQLEKRLIRKDGDLVWVNASASVVVDAEGKPDHLVYQTIDLSVAKDAEARLLQVQKLEAVGQLVGGIAHDFNNLLTVILGNAKLLSRQMDGDEKASRRLDALRRAADRGAEMTKRLLAFGRRQPLDAKSVDVGGLVVGITDMLRRGLTESVELTIETAPELPAVRVDPGQLESALLNLAINARDAMDGRGRLGVIVEQVLVDALYAQQAQIVPEGTYVCITVSDSGSGMPPEVLARIFEPFFTTKDVGKGTGLGLAMVYGFVKQSGGYITVYSDPGNGTTFRLYFPPAAEEVQAAADVTAGSLDNMVLSGRVLLVEDDPDVMDITAQLLGSVGLAVTSAPGPAVALELLREKKPFDLLITDVMMPGGMNDFELAQRARTMVPGLKVLCMSGYAGTPKQLEDLDLTEIRTLGKPYRHEDLVRLLADMLAVPSVADQRVPVMDAAS
jgi:PAS domain S-box-containing protein